MAEIIDLGELVLKDVSKKFNKKIRKLEIKVANKFKEYASAEAPSGNRSWTGKEKLKDILLNLKIRKDMDRSGINAMFRKGKGEISIYLIVSDSEKFKKIKWVNDGTGIHGPYGKPIKPKNKPFLAWEDPQGVWHYAKSVSGQVGHKFLESASKKLQKDLKGGL